MINLEKLPKDLQKAIISVYLIGHENGICQLPLFNNFSANESKIEYLNAILNPETKECELERIDEVS